MLESALDGEITDHLGYDRHDPAGANSGNTRNGARAKTVLTDVGPVEIGVPRDRQGSFEPQIVRKRQRRLSGVEDLVLSLSAKGLTTGEISAHLAEVYGAEVSRQTISTITDKVMDGMAEWQNRPLDRVYPVVFLDAIHVKIRDGKVANRPVYVALAVTVDGCRDILGLWAGDGGEGAKFWFARVHRAEEPGRRGRADGRLRRAQGPARGDRRGVAADRGPNVCGAPTCGIRSGTPAGSTTTPSPRRCGRSTPPRPRPPRPNGSWSSPRPGASKYPAIVKLWENAWAEFVPFLAFDPEIRRVICSTNAIESR